MSKQNLKSYTKSRLNPVKISKRLPYRQPEIHFLGSLKRVESGYEGDCIDGNSTYYWC